MEAYAYPRQILTRAIESCETDLRALKKLDETINWDSLNRDDTLLINRILSLIGERFHHGPNH